ncbi:ankyrin repeat-containing domain protein [Dactylonectria estremocensis]|uniref:Ankyrin repeat-containing domain protein n=1 Tax=Dactylonectria estremocensis TaxID=1079267 RepID=A0A9P9ES02_9HYPO|nr:ankyrin repeat-containing domain protein [Dactylonectria estremocensis]
MDLAQKLVEVCTTDVNDIFAPALVDCVSRIEFSFELADLLISRGLDVNRTSEPHFTALHAACSEGSVDAVRWPLEKNAKVDMPGGQNDTTLCVAVESSSDSKEKARLLLDRGVEIKFVEEDQHTALRRATCYANEPLIELLLGRGANANLTGGELNAPLNAAIARDIELSTIGLMIEKGTILDAQDHEGKTPLAREASLNHLQVVNRLLKRGADPRVVDCRNRSSLYWAARDTQVETLRSIVIAMESSERDLFEYWDVVVHGAVASNKR